MLALDLHDALVVVDAQPPPKPLFRKRPERRRHVQVTAGQTVLVAECWPSTAEQEQELTAPRLGAALAGGLDRAVPRGPAVRRAQARAGHGAGPADAGLRGGGRRRPAHPRGAGRLGPAPPGVGYPRVTRGAAGSLQGHRSVGRDPVLRVSCLSRAAFGLSAFVSAGALVVLSAAPGAAATPVAQASAAAISLTVGGQAGRRGQLPRDQRRHQERTRRQQQAGPVAAGRAVPDQGRHARAGRQHERRELPGPFAGLRRPRRSGRVESSGSATAAAASCRVRPSPSAPDPLDLSGLQIVQSAFLQGFDAQAPRSRSQPILQPLTAALQTRPPSRP